MKLKELKDIIKYEEESIGSCDELEVVIVINADSFCGIPFVKVDKIFTDIDWNSGKLFIKANTKLASDDDLVYHEGQQCKKAILQYLWDKKDKIPSFYTKEFLKCLNKIPEWFGVKK